MPAAKWITCWPSDFRINACREPAIDYIYWLWCQLFQAILLLERGQTGRQTDRQTDRQKHKVMDITITLPCHSYHQHARTWADRQLSVLSEKVTDTGGNDVSSKCRVNTLKSAGERWNDGPAKCLVYYLTQIATIRHDLDSCGKSAHSSHTCRSDTFTDAGLMSMMLMSYFIVKVAGLTRSHCRVTTQLNTVSVTHYVLSRLLQQNGN